MNDHRRQVRDAEMALVKVLLDTPWSETHDRWSWTAGPYSIDTIKRQDEGLPMTVGFSIYAIVSDERRATIHITKGKPFRRLKRRAYKMASARIQAEGRDADSAHNKGLADLLWRVKA